MSSAVRPTLAEIENARIIACRYRGDLVHGRATEDEIAARLAGWHPADEALIRFELELLRRAREQRVYTIERTPELLAELNEAWRAARGQC